jgi:PAS domain S-box-containing protein
VETNQDEKLFEALRAAAEIFGMAVLVTVTEQETPQVVYLSSGIEQLLGCGADEIRERPVWSFIAPEELPRLVQAQQSRVDGDRTPRFQEFAVIRKDGVRVPVEMFSSIVDRQGQKATVSFIRDISLRKSAEEKLRQSEERFRSLVENAPDGIAILQHGRVAFINAAAARLAGVSDPEQGVAMPVTELLQPDDREQYETRLSALNRTGAPLGPPAFYRARDIEGRERVAEASAIPIQYRGEPAVLGFVRDVTERVEMQAKLVQSDRLAALGLLAGGIAHEINNPLAYAKLNLTRAARKLAALSVKRKDDSDLAELSESLAVAEEGLERAANIVRDIQLFARPTPDVKGPLDVRAALERALSLAGYAIGRKANVTRDFGENIPGVSGNASLLEQMFLNLFINAAESFDQEDKEKNRVAVSLHNDGNGGVVVEVVDNGRGMTAWEAEHALDPFFSTGATGNGGGLGLAICKSIVDEMGGAIELRSRPGEGTAFRITLPAGQR